MDTPWYESIFPIALLKLIGIRNSARSRNLKDTSDLPDKSKLPKAQPCDLKYRSADGSHNDPSAPEMGMANTRFGRNTPLWAVPAQKNVMVPNPADVAKILKRDEFVPATTLNLIAAAWIQFQTHDWFSHGGNQEECIPGTGVRKTLRDASRTGDYETMPTFINTETHWWDASQLYGSDACTQARLRTHAEGKMKIVDGAIPSNDKGMDDVGNPGLGGWWVGLSMMHTLFVKEHNLLCEKLAALPEASSWSDDDIFNHSRLIIAAMLAKIHTVEWTPAILSNPIIVSAMNTNWYGIFGKMFKETFGRVSSNEVVSGIVGGETDHHDSPYCMTEEFVSVYRMHPLIPDVIPMRHHNTGESLGEQPFKTVFGANARTCVRDFGMANLLYSFGTTHPGDITLHNYPNFMRKMMTDKDEPFDLAAVDIIRDRERGVPRYNRFLEVVGKTPAKTFSDITSNKVWASELEALYDTVDDVDLMVGMYAEDKPPGFGFSDTAFRIFILMASRRLQSDRFFTTCYNKETYTQFGLDWIKDNTMLTVIRRHHPELQPALVGVENAFKPW